MTAEPPAAGGGDHGDAAPRSWARLGLVVAALVAGALLVVLAAALGNGQADLAANEPAPDFRLQTFDGQSLRLRDLRGQVVVVNFWASWCVECKVEAAALQALSDKYAGRGVVVLGVDYTDTESAARSYLDRFGITYPNGPDEGGRISRDYRITGVPETLVIDPEGRIVPLPLRGQDVPSPRLTGPLSDAAGLSAAELEGLVADLASRAP